ncbi:hypothetical protein ACQV2S_02765 [Facklamia sp. P13064]|uniref:hypothetical protein n=1 Tax=Facklamia sp. P13064 TaxID=3421953 RepID=UPI003D167432
MQLKKILTVIVASILFSSVSFVPKTYAMEDDNNIDFTQQNEDFVPYGTVSGNAGTTTIEIMSGNTVYWYAKPYFSGNYTLFGAIDVTFRNNRKVTYYLSESGKSGRAVSGIINLRATPKKVTLSGICYGPKNLAFVLPNSDAYKY